MAVSDFWHDLAAEFRALPGGSAIRGEWDYTANSGRPYQWRFAGGGKALHARFEALARRAASEMPHPEYSDALLSWLEAIRKNSDQPGTIGNYSEQNADGTEGPVHVVGSLRNLCEESAIYCNQLEADARQREFEEKQRNDPRNWPYVRQRYETFKQVKELISGPRETVSEAFLRNALAEQYGIKPEEVTWKQIQLGLADLGRYYPAITLIPTEIAPSQRPSEAASSPDSTPTTKETPSSSQPREQIERFILKMAQGGTKIKRKDIWRVAGYKDATEFERFQRGDERNQSAVSNFTRILKMEPQDFLRLLKQIRN